MRLIFAFFVFLVPVFASCQDVVFIYKTHCSSCHGLDRLGGSGPALLPENLGRLKPVEATDVIAQGRPATQMLGFSNKLSGNEIQSLVDYIYTPLASVPEMGLKEIESTRIVWFKPSDLSDKPVYGADFLNLFFVVELGDHHVTVLDGDKLEPIFRFPSRFALHGGLKYSSDGRYVYLASRDGWISKFDVFNLKMVAEVRAGINTRNVAVSADNKYVMVANYLPNTLVVLDAVDLKPLNVISVNDGKGKTSRVSAVYTAAPRYSFVVALKDIAEVWEIPYSEKAGILPISHGLVHDYRKDSGEDVPFDARDFPIRRMQLDDFLDDFFFDQKYEHLIGAGRNSKKGQVVNLVVGRKIADVDLSGMPHLGSGITWNYQGKPVLATPNLAEGVVTVVDMQTWKVVKQIKTLGPGFFMRSHENTNYAWVDVSLGADKDAVQVIDKRTLEIVKTLRPIVGKTAKHVEFDRYGKYAVLSIWEDDGALVVYDATTLQEVKRIPMRKPSGKYNVYNKINLSSGTSH